MLPLVIKREGCYVYVTGGPTWNGYKTWPPTLKKATVLEHICMLYLRGIILGHEISIMACDLGMPKDMALEFQDVLIIARKYGTGVQN